MFVKLRVVAYKSPDTPSPPLTTRVPFVGRLEAVPVL